jgi:hypothetical protein
MLLLVVPGGLDDTWPEATVTTLQGYVKLVKDISLASPYRLTAKADTTQICSQEIIERI